MSSLITKVQGKILGVLSKHGKPMTRQEIADKLGYSSSVAVYQQVGWPDEQKRAAWEEEHGRKTLLGANQVKQVIVKIDADDKDSPREMRLSITEKGEKALAAASENGKPSKGASKPAKAPKEKKAAKKPVSPQEEPQATS